MIRPEDSQAKFKQLEDVFHMGEIEKHNYLVRVPHILASGKKPPLPPGATLDSP